MLTERRGRFPVKRIFAVLLACLLLTMTTLSAAASQQDAADALNHLGLFLGTDTGYELDASLTRAQGITLLVRLLGAEEEAQKTSYTIPFKDVADWAKPYVGYAYAHKITNGVSARKFGSDSPMTDNMFLTLCLRALGHKDSKAKDSFTWKNPYVFAQRAGLITTTEKDVDFLRGDAAAVMWNALSAPMATESGTLADTLVKKGVFLQDTLETAIRIQKEELPQSTPSAPVDTTYEQYMNMTAEGKQAFLDTFPSTEDFFLWYHQAQEDHEAAQAVEQIAPNGVIDVNKLFSEN